MKGIRQSDFEDIHHFKFCQNLDITFCLYQVTFVCEHRVNVDLSLSTEFAQPGWKEIYCSLSDVIKPWASWFNKEHWLIDNNFFSSN